MHDSPYIREQRSPTCYSRARNFTLLQPNHNESPPPTIRHTRTLGRWLFCSGNHLLIEGLLYTFRLYFDAVALFMIFSWWSRGSYDETQVSLPALFMLLLVWIKSLTTVYDSPTAAYTCGQTIPWQYEEHLPINPSRLISNPLIKCLQQPPECSAAHYYRDEGGFFDEAGLTGVRSVVPASNTSQIISGAFVPNTASATFKICFAFSQSISKRFCGEDNKSALVGWRA